jgi:hypothetical protein
MAKFKKKQVYVDAWVWDESKKTLELIGCKMASCLGHEDRPDECSDLRIFTPAGAGSVKHGDFIIKDGDGGYWSCDPERFSENYEPA